MVGPLGPQALAFAVAHMLLALVVHYVSFAAAVHAFATVGVGLWWAWSEERPERIAYMAAYITGAEVLWRMTNDQLFWELGKYALVAICASATFRLRRPALVWSMLAFSLLLPSAVLTVVNYPLAEAQNQLSFNLSGPLALCVSAGFFSSVTLTREQFQRLCLALVGPAIGIGTITLYSIAINPNIEFSHQSNFALSGGFGPNQVSAALGLGALMALLCLFEKDARPYIRLGLLGVTVWLAMQSALTFSRGGLFAAVGAAAVSLALSVTEPRQLVRATAIGMIVVALGYFVVWPRLDNFTGGNITQRFTDTDTSLRADLSEADMQLWRDNRMLGVGPGRSKLGHLDDIIAHTEFTRLLAEHGNFGVLFMVLMGGFGAWNTLRGYSGRERGLSAACTTWALLFMANSAMRLVAPSFMFGLAFCVFIPGPVVKKAVPQVRRPRWRLVSQTPAA